MDLTIIKRGETCLNLSLSRPLKVPSGHSGLGLLVSVKAHPAVEEFCRGVLGNGPAVSIEAISRGWIGGESEKPLLVYPTGQRCSFAGSTIAFSLDNVGGVLYSGDTVNLSFLRIAGISEGNGISFYVKGMFSVEAMKNMQEKIALAMKMFYQEYIRPVDMMVTVSLQELKL